MSIKSIAMLAVVGLAMVIPFLVVYVVLDIQFQKFDMRDCLCNARDHRRHRVLP